MWIALTLLTAGCTALRDVASKHAVRGSDPLTVALGITAVPALALGAIVVVLGPAAPTDGFWTALLISGGINALATPMIVVALQRSDLSLVAPVTSLTPLFMLATGAVVLGEFPGPTGVVGVTVIVAGAYLLSISQWHAGVLAPFRALLRDPGARAMLLVAFLYSISASYDKVGTRASDPLLWAAAIHGVTAAVLLPLVVWRRSNGSGTDGRNGRSATRPQRALSRTTAPVGPRAPWTRRPAAAILLAGTFTAIGAAAQMTALMLTLAAYVIAVKRTSTLFGVLLGHSVFREEHVAERLLGAVVMLVGFLLVTLG